MWRCARCGTRNQRTADHCGSCGMPNPFGDGGSTRTMDIPADAARRSRPEPEPEPRPGLPWLTIALAVLGIVLLLLFAVAALSS